MQHFAKLPLVLLLLLLVSFVASVPLNNEMEASANGLSERVKRGYGGYGGGGGFGGGGGMGGGGGYGGTCSGGSNGCSPGWSCRWSGSGNTFICINIANIGTNNGQVNNGK
uniref:Glycine-rich protein 2-like n=1 Tax=Globodera pallida TaxID=36090 RepID=A0A183BYA5_GLOPA